jgi:hypothetical protein
MFPPDEFPMPAHQSLWRDNRCHFREQFSPRQPGFDREAAALIVREAKAPATKLNPNDAIFLPQILDCVLLLLIHPSGNGKEQKTERVQSLRHRFKQPNISHPGCPPGVPITLALNPFQFSYITGLEGFR